MSIRKLALAIAAAAALTASTLVAGAAPATAATPTVAAPAVMVVAGPGLPHDPNLFSPAARQLMGPCFCGGNFTMPSIAPWDNAACNSHMRVGNTIAVNARISTSTSTYKVGYAEWLYSSNGTCNGYQWMHFVLNIGLVRRYLGYDDAHMRAIVGAEGDFLHWSTQYVDFIHGPGQTDGDLWTRAIQVYAGRTWGAMPGQCCPDPDGYLEFNTTGNGGYTMSS